MAEEINKTEITATKVKKYVECKVIIEPEINPSYWWKDLSKDEQTKRIIRLIRNWVKEPEDFFKEHGKEDYNDIYVDIIETDVCSNCGAEWETYEEETGTIICNNCGALVKSA